jgi:lysophospholipase L1-like esterase
MAATARSLNEGRASVSAHVFRRHPRRGRALLLFFGSVVLPLLVLEFGLRVAPLFLDRERSTAVAAGPKRVVCIGDSFTFGVYFPAAASYPRRLQAWLDAALGPGSIAVVPAGRPGRPTSEIRALLPELLLRERPDVVVVLGGINDRWNHRFASGPLQFLADHLRLFRVAQIWIAARLGGRLDDDRPRAGDPMEGAITLDDETLRTRVEENLRAVAAAIRGAGATPLFLTYPAADAAFVAVNGAIRDAAGASGAQLLDLTGLFAREQAARRDVELLIPGDRHPYPAGYDLMARAVAEAIVAAIGGPRAIASPTRVASAAAEEKAIELALAPAAPPALLVTAPPHRRFQIVVSRTRTPPLRLQRCDLDLGDDELFKLSAKLPWLSGTTDADGRARIELPAETLDSSRPGADGLRAAALLLDVRTPERGNVRIWAEASSAVLALIPASQPAK